MIEDAEKSSFCDDLFTKSNQIYQIIIWYNACQVVHKCVKNFHAFQEDLSETSIHWTGVLEYEEMLNVFQGAPYYNFKWH